MHVCHVLPLTNTPSLHEQEQLDLRAKTTEVNEAKFNMDALTAAGAMGGSGERKAGVWRKNWSPLKGANRLVMLMAKDTAKANQARRRSSLAASPPSRQNSSCAAERARRASCGGLSLCSGGAGGLALGGVGVGTDGTCGGSSTASTSRPLTASTAAPASAERSRRPSTSKERLEDAEASGKVPRPTPLIPKPCAPTPLIPKPRTPTPRTPTHYVMCCVMHRRPTRSGVSSGCVRRLTSSASPRRAPIQRGSVAARSRNCSSTFPGMSSRAAARTSGGATRRARRRHPARASRRGARRRPTLQQVRCCYRRTDSSSS